MERHELIQVKIELGHKAWCRKQPTREGFTHDWVMFVRGPDNSDVSHFVEKVVFLLHESFAKPKRVVKDPPYKLEECGYGSFHLPVEVYFKNKEEPKKVFFEYDLLLPGLGLPPVSNIRSEALTFKNPTDEFKRKVLKAGGVVISNTNGYHSSSVNGNGSQISSSCKTVKKSSSANSSPTGETLDRTPAKKIKSDKTVKSKLSNESASPAPATLSSKRPADTDSGMTPVTKKKKKSPENSKSRLVGFLLDSADGIKEKKEESIKHKLKALAGKGNVEKSEKGEKKKERKVPLESPIATKKKDSTSAVKKGKEKMTTSPEQEHKITVKSETKLSTKSVSKPIPKTEMKTPKIVKSAVKQERKDLTSRQPKSHSKLDSKHKHLKKEGKKVEKITIRRNSNESWSSSASSSSSLFTGGPAAANANKNNALGTLLAELGDDDEDDDIDVCGLSDSSKQIECMQPSSETGKVSSVHSNASTNNNNVKTLANGGLSKHSSNSQNERHEPSLKKQNDNKSMVKQKETEKLHLQKSGHKVKLESEKLSSSSGKTFASNLLTLHKKLTSLKDSASLQKVVDILETTGSFVITETSFKFDLCTLDPETVRKIESCVNR